MVAWSGRTNRSAGFYLPRQDFQALQHDESSNDGVGGGDSWDDVTRHSWKKDRHLPEGGGHYRPLVLGRVQAQEISILTLSRDNLHLTSKRLFMFMLKMCIRKFAAALTKSIAGGSS